MQNLSADTMTTNTAALICVGLKVIAVVAGLILVWAFPESRLCSSSLDFCEYFHPAMFYFYSLPYILTSIIVLGVVGFTMYRAHTFVSIPPQEEPAEKEESAGSSSSRSGSPALITPGRTYQCRKCLRDYASTDAVRRNTTVATRRRTSVSSLGGGVEGTSEVHGLLRHEHVAGKVSVRVGSPFAFAAEELAQSLLPVFTADLNGSD